MFRTMQNYWVWLMTILMVVYLLAMPLASYGQDKSEENKNTVTKKESLKNTPDISEIIPLATKLEAELAALENKLIDLLDIKQVESDFEALHKQLKTPEESIASLKKLKKKSYNSLIALKNELDKDNKSFEEISEPLKGAISQLGKWRNEWLKEKKQWHQWEIDLHKEGTLKPLDLTFAKADANIEKSLHLILPRLESMLKLQDKGSKNQVIINGFEVEINTMIEVHLKSVLTAASPPMFSSSFFDELSGELWHEIKRGVRMVVLPNSKYFSSVWWILLLQLFVTIGSIMIIYQNKQKILSSEKYKFLAQRPVDAGLFFGSMATIAIYQMEKSPDIWMLFITVVGGISYARLSSIRFKPSWERNFIYGLMILFIITRIMDAIHFPMPLYRVYIVLVSLLGIVFSLRWARKKGRVKVTKNGFFGLYLIALFLVFTFVAEILGEESLAFLMYEALISTMVIILVYLMFMFLIRGGLILLFERIVNKESKTSKSDVESSVHRLSFVMDGIIIIFAVIPLLLARWGVFESTEEARTELMSMGFNLGKIQITSRLLINAFLILYGAYAVSVIGQLLFLDKIFSKKNVEKGARLAVKNILYTIIMFIGFLIALSALGFEITKLTIMLSALSVGIGFGLQGVVNNFVSGLILLFERPIREGDSIDVGGIWATVRKIGLRSTIVETADEADLIVPNSDLVYNQVTNWTLTNRHIRLKIPVGVAYGSDVALVIKTLMDVAKANTNVFQDHAPQVLFLDFGDSTLNFELRVWVIDATTRMPTRSELHQDIDRRFREANIEIAFPQRDLHLRSVDKSIQLKPKDPGK